MKRAWVTLLSCGLGVLLLIPSIPLHGAVDSSAAFDRQKARQDSVAPEKSAGFMTIPLVYRSQSESLELRSVSENPEDYYKFAGEIISKDPSVARDLFRLVKVSEKGLYYDAGGSLRWNPKIVSDLVMASDDMAILGTIEQTIDRSSVNYLEMTEAVLAVLSSALSVPISPSAMDLLRQLITQTLTNLKEDEGSKSFFWESLNDSSSSYRYHVLFAIQNGDTGANMMALPMSITIRANRSRQSLFAITLSDRTSYSMKTVGLEIIKLLSMYQ